MGPYRANAHMMQAGMHSEDICALPMHRKTEGSLCKRPCNVALEGLYALYAEGG